MVRKINEESIKKQAKEILDRFAQALEKVEKESEIEYYVERDEFKRDEKNDNNSINGFKEKILDNAPKKDSDFIIAEKGNWK